jgi:hypothetical protein
LLDYPEVRDEPGWAVLPNRKKEKEVRKKEAKENERAEVSAAFLILLGLGKMTL